MRLICIARTLMTLSRGEGDAFKDLDAARKFLHSSPASMRRASESSGSAWAADSR